MARAASQRQTAPASTTSAARAVSSHRAPGCFPHHFLSAVQHIPGGVLGLGSGLLLRRQVFAPEQFYHGQPQGIRQRLQQGQVGETHARSQRDTVRSEM